LSWCFGKGDRRWRGRQNYPAGRGLERKTWGGGHSGEIMRGRPVCRKSPLKGGLFKGGGNNPEGAACSVILKEWTLNYVTVSGKLFGTRGAAGAAARALGGGEAARGGASVTTNGNKTKEITKKMSEGRNVYFPI